MAEGNGNGGGAPAASAPSWLSARTFGMPRWAFAGLIAGGLILGLYLRARAREAQAGDQASADAVPPEEVGVDSAQLADYAGTGVLAGGATGQVIPVTAPIIPEGFPEVFAGLGGTIESLGSAIADTAGQEPPQVTVVAPAAAPKPKPKPKPRPSGGGGGCVGGRKPNGGHCACGLRWNAKKGKCTQ